MTKDNKGSASGKDASPNTFDSSLHNEVDLLRVWINLGTPLYYRQKKRGWYRWMAMKSKIKSAITGLAIWGVIPAGLATWLIQHGGLKDA